jgi:hypothetical protein
MSTEDRGVEDDKKTDKLTALYETTQKKEVCE